MKMKLFSTNLMLVALTGCAAYQLEPVPINHPAHAEARIAPRSSSSKTLAYTSDDIPARMTGVAAAQNDGHDAHHPAGSSQTAVGEGKVIATVPNSNQLVVEHGEIKGIMEAMTMGYPIDPPSLLEGLKPGDRIRFTMDVQKKTIVNVEKLDK